MIEKQCDYYIAGRLSINNSVIDKVECKIYLPKSLNDRPRMYFLLDKEKYIYLSRQWQGSFFAENKEVSIFASKIYFIKSEARYWGETLFEVNFEVEPTDLKIVKKLSDCGCTDMQVVFYLSKNELLNPRSTGRIYYTGDIEEHELKHISVPFYGHRKLKFINVYTLDKLSDEQQVRTKYLVATVNLPDDKVNINNDLLPLVDDLLLLIGLATKKRTVCLKWTARTNEKVIDFYRCNFEYPKGGNKESVDGNFFSLEKLQAYLDIVWTSFKKYPNKEYLRGAIYSAVPGIDAYIGQEYLSAFSGIEKLMLDYRRTNNLEFNIPRTAWNKMSRQIKKCLKVICDDREDISKEQYSNMVMKISELNRISLQEAWKRFQEEYGIHTNILWPLFDDKIISLSKIRNWLIHGEPIPSEYYSDIVIANQNLHILLERILFSVLKYDASKTTASDDYLLKNGATFLIDMPAAQKHIGRLLKNF